VSSHHSPLNNCSSFVPNLFWKGKWFKWIKLHQQLSILDEDTIANRSHELKIIQSTILHYLENSSSTERNRKYRLTLIATGEEVLSKINFKNLQLKTIDLLMIIGQVAAGSAGPVPPPLIITGTVTPQPILITKICYCVYELPLVDHLLAVFPHSMYIVLYKISMVTLYVCSAIYCIWKLC